MSNKKLIFEYLDGELSRESEGKLFSELAADSALRSDFNRLVKLESLTKADMSGIAPPSEAANEVFSNLGFKIPASDYVPAKASGFGSLAKKYGPFALLLLLLSTLAIGSYFGFEYNSLRENLTNTENQLMQVNEKNAKLRSSIVAEQQKLAETRSKYEDRIAYLSSTSVSSQPSSDLKGQADADRNHSGYDASEINSSLSQNIGQSSSDGGVVNSELMAKTENGTGLNNNSINKAFDQESQSQYYHSSTIDKLYSAGALATGVIIPLRIAPFSGEKSYFSEPLVSIYLEKYDNLGSSISSVSGANNTVYENLSLTVNYNFDELHALGIQAGTENFPQQFNRRIEGINAVQTQNPVLFYYGVNYRFTAKNWIIPYTFYPYLNAFTGATTIGGIFRTQAGMELRIYGNVRIHAGLDYNLLIYNYDNTLYDTQKTGFKSGISVGF